MIALMLEWYRSWKLHRATHADISDQMCVACESADITSYGEGVYTCNQCGYEGGSGHAAMIKERRFASFDRMSPEERRESALQDLQQARHVLLSGIGYFESSLSYSQGDILGFGEGRVGAEEGSEKLADMVQGARLLQEAQHLLQDALYKLHGHPDGALAFDIEIDYSKWAFDLHFDNIFSDLHSHHQITQAHSQATSVLHEVENTLSRHFGYRSLAT